MLLLLVLIWSDATMIRWLTVVSRWFYAWFKATQRRSRTTVKILSSLSWWTSLLLSRVNIDHSMTKSPTSTIFILAISVANFGIRICIRIGRDIQTLCHKRFLFMSLQWNLLWYNTINIGISWLRQSSIIINSLSCDWWSLRRVTILN